ncbi:MAG TPA: zinc-ribbon domain-containing protein, partial [Clostridiaceae bacterium]|nr:zinc-ribbon domain-containing protein [Clostridiaceae bacterium]
MRICPYCNSELPERAKFCMECGQRQPTSTLFRSDRQERDGVVKKTSITSPSPKARVDRNESQAG